MPMTLSLLLVVPEARDCAGTARPLLFSATIEPT